MGTNVINKSIFSVCRHFCIPKCLAITLYLLLLLSNLPKLPIVEQLELRYFNFRQNPPKVSKATSTLSHNVR